MKVRSALGAMLVILLPLAAYDLLPLAASDVQAQKNTASERRHAVSEIDAGIDTHARQMVETGRRVFRFDTFGSEGFWGDSLQLHKAIAGEKNGGVGAGLSPKTALSVGLKVDSDALPASLKQQIKHGTVDLDNPATTLALLKLNSITERKDRRGCVTSSSTGRFWG